MVTLRNFNDNDIDRLVHILNDEVVTEFLSTKIPYPYTSADAAWWVNEGSQSGIIKAISYDDVLVGCIGVNRGQFEYERSGEIGYWLDKQYWRKGITSEAIRQMTDFVFAHTNIVRIFGAVFAGNHASMQLLLKSGFNEEAILKKAIYKNGRFYDKHVFAKLLISEPSPIEQA
ncbi:GNAT family N-acetyltransferase [Alteromonas stellipolaris]|uniref:GNAT family N-acetyltransferase n=1 Tax=Alteromonas stellipolaris TaxID=233316 RepID=UPI003562C338